MEQKNELQIQFREGDADAEIVTARSWRGVSVQFSRLRLPAEYEFSWDGASQYLCYHDLVLADGEMEVLGEAPISGGDLRETITYVPAGQTIQGWAKPVDRLNSFTAVCFDPAAMEAEFQVAFNASDSRPNIYFKNNELGATMRKLARLMAEDSRPVTRVYAETMGLAAALEMLMIGQADPVGIKPSGQLSRAQVSLVKDYIEENLANDIGLDDLSSVCRLTRFHFARAFKTTFGEPPHRYLTLRRMEQAKKMLATTRLSISDVAGACGFNGVSQFGRSFRDVVGKTPLEFRRQA